MGVVKTNLGAQFDPTSDVWKYEDGVDEVHLDFSYLTGASQNIIDSAKATLALMSQRCSPNHLTNLFERLKSLHIFLNRSVISSISAIDLMSYRADLGRTREWYLGQLRGMLLQWHSLKYEGLDADAASYLLQVRLKGNTKGKAVATMDLRDGPFSHIEAESLQADLNQAFGSGRITKCEFVLAWLCILLGQRNKQHAALKVRDVISRQVNGIPSYSIMMPRAKQRSQKLRSALVERPVNEQFGTVLKEYADEVAQYFNGILPDPQQAPLFPDMSSPGAVQGFEYHPTSQKLYECLKDLFATLGTRSERTGDPINVTPTRFRRTIGTRAAEEGYGALVIAHLLDHSDTQHVGVYSATSPAIIERIDRAIALDLAPLAQAFAGTVSCAKEGDKGSDRRIVDLRIDTSGGEMGRCGGSGACNFNAPIACYTCFSFKAWVDGPHEAVLDHLISRREKLLLTSDQRIASVNDRSILAVAAVVQACIDYKLELSSI